MKIKELTKEIMNIVVPEKEIKIVSPKAAKAFIKALMNSKKVSKFLSKLPDYIEASKANEEERIAMLAFAFGMDESQEKEFEKMQAIFKDKNPESQNTRKAIARIIMSPSYDLDKVLDKMNTSQDVVKNENKKGEKETMKNKKDKTKEEAKHNEKVKKDVEKEEEVKEASSPIKEIVSRVVVLTASPDKIKDLINDPMSIKDVFKEVISDDFIDLLTSDAGISDKKEAKQALLAMAISAIALTNKTKRFDVLEKWLTLVLEGKSFEEIMKGLNVKKKDIKLKNDDSELDKKFAVLANKVTGVSTSEESVKLINKVLNEFIEDGSDLVNRLEKVEEELKEESKASEKAADVVHEAVNTIKKVTIKPDPETIFNEPSSSLKVMVENGSLIVGETYVVKVGDNRYTARLLCLGGDQYMFELGSKVASM